jgi:microcystin-dependent protein
MDVFIGLIRLLPYNRTPRGWLPCEGQILQIQQNAALFALISNKFGGDGRTTFALPNLKGFEPQPGARYFMAMAGLFPPRS